MGMPSTSAQSHQVTRPGSAPKVRTRTPNGPGTDSKTATQNSSTPSSAQQNLMLRNTGSSSGLHNQTTLQNSNSGTIGSKDASKNIMNSFRNGPVK